MPTVNLEQSLEVARKRIFYLCPDDQTPTGGIKQIYRHVEVLDNAGFDASVLHNEPGFRVGWFQNKARVGSVSEFTLTREDWLVVPEVYGPAIHRMWEPAHLVVFNQNAYYTFLGYPVDDKPLEFPYDDPRVEAVITNSADGKKYLEYAFAQTPCLIRYGIPEFFDFEAAKQKSIAFMPRKRPEDASQVINILKHRGALDSWKLQPIDGVSEEEVAGLLKESAIFMAFGAPEGVALPPVEAIACGCVVIGYHGQGGREYMLRRLLSVRPVEVGNIRRLAIHIEAAIEGFNRKGDRYLLRSRERASRFVRGKYSMESERRSIIAFWTGMLAAGRSRNRGSPP